MRACCLRAGGGLDSSNGHWGLSTPATSSSLVAAIHTHHAELAQKLTEYTGQFDAEIDQFDASLLTDLLTQLGSFLTDELLPHAQGEEHVLYPALDPVIAQHGSPTATMRIDHEYLTRFIQEATDLAGKLRSVGQRERDPIAAQLQRVLGHLQTLLMVHLTKEERMYLPLVEQHFSPDEQQRLLGELHEAAAAQTPKAEDGHEMLDVRSLPPTQRHSLIFARFAALAEGDWFVLVNDHDPKPLYYQLNAETVSLRAVSRASADPTGAGGGGGNRTRGRGTDPARLAGRRCRAHPAGFDCRAQSRASTPAHSPSDNA